MTHQNPAASERFRGMGGSVGGAKRAARDGASFSLYLCISMSLCFRGFQVWPGFSSPAVASRKGTDTLWVEPRTEECTEEP
jgi:hypothetical protein